MKVERGTKWRTMKNAVEKTDEKYRRRRERLIGLTTMLTVLATLFALCLSAQVDNAFEDAVLIEPPRNARRHELATERSPTPERTNEEVSSDKRKIRPKIKEAILEPKPTNPNPKVALLFLTGGPMHHEPLWRAFFEAAGKLSLRHPPPDLTYLDSIEGKDARKFDKINNSKTRRLEGKKDPLAATVCPGEDKMIGREVKRLMKVPKDPTISYYFPRTSIFYKREIQKRINSTDVWGKFKLLEAELYLLDAALQDTNNKKFILLSESCVPLHPPGVIYAQVLSEEKSRMRSCRVQNNTRLMRYSDDMSAKFFKKKHWRKNPQWFTINRAHADFIAKETYVKERFRAHCDGYYGKRCCISDEHYIPTVLYVYGLGRKTDCIGNTTYAEFNPGNPHPKTYNAKEINATLIVQLRHVWGCYVGDTWSTVGALLDGVPHTNTCLDHSFPPVDPEKQTDQSHDWVTERGYKPMKPNCVLFARKFPNSTVVETLKASISCEGGGLGYWC